MKSFVKVILVLGLAFLLITAWDASSLAQCSMCRASLAGSGNSSFIRNFNIAVLVLLIPPVAIFCSIFWILSRHRRNETDDQ